MLGPSQFLSLGSSTCRCRRCAPAVLGFWDLRILGFSFQIRFLSDPLLRFHGLPLPPPRTCCMMGRLRHCSRSTLTGGMSRMEPGGERAWGAAVALPSAPPPGTGLPLHAPPPRELHICSAARPVQTPPLSGDFKLGKTLNRLATIAAVVAAASAPYGVLRFYDLEALRLTVGVSSWQGSIQGVRRRRDLYRGKRTRSTSSKTPITRKQTPVG